MTMPNARTRRVTLLDLHDYDYRAVAHIGRHSSQPTSDAPVLQLYILGESHWQPAAPMTYSISKAPEANMHGRHAGGP